MRLPSLVVAIAAAVAVVASKSRVSVYENGYGNVVVAIADDVDEVDGTSLIDAIQTTFYDASTYLYAATGRRIFFRNVTILVPSTWTASSYDAAVHETYARADVRIAAAAVASNQIFAVRYSSECGREGEYIFANSKRFSSETTGGRALVHEWARYRWGVYDEHPTRLAQLYTYLPRGRFEPTKCSDALSGDVVHRDNGGVCHPTSAHEEGGGLCVFRSTTGGDSEGEAASIMFYQDISQVTRFCGIDESASNAHNVYANNDQNAFCGYQSTWDVIRQHADLQNVAPTDLTANQLKPIFNVVQGRSYDQIVLVIDVSTSMIQQRRLEKVRQVAYLFIGALPVGTQVGIVAFSATAEIRLNLTTITENPKSRQSIYDALPDTTVGATSIGSGILAALQVIRQANGGKFQARSSMIVLNDNDETARPYLDSVVEELFASGVAFFSVTIDHESSRPTSLLTYRKLRNVVENTGGYQYVVPVNGNQQLAALQSIFSSIVERVLSRGGPVNLVQESKEVNANRKNATQSFVVDSTASRRLHVQIALDVSESSPLAFSAVAISPDGTRYDGDSSAFRAIQIPIENPQEGKWDVVVDVSSPLSMTTSVVIGASAYSSPGQGIGPMTIVPKISEWDTMGSIPSLFSVAVKRGEKRLIGGDVWATIISPSGDISDWKLADNGADPDYRADDGIYSSYFTGYVGLGKRGQYNVQFKAKSTEKSTLVDPAPYRDTSALYMSGDEGTTSRDEDETVDIVPSFQRTTSGGMMTYNDFIEPNADIYPPSRIVDFRVTDANYTQSRVTLTWTAPGDDFDRGTVQGYVIRWARDDDAANLLRRNPQNATRLSPSEFRVEGTALIAPKPAGETENMTMTLPRNANNTYYFIIQATDDDEKRGDFSPILAVALLPYVPLPLDDNDGLSSGAIAGIVVGCVVAIAVVAIIIVVVCVKRSRDKDPASVDTERARLEESPMSQRSLSSPASGSDLRGRQKRRQKKSLTANEEVISLDNAGSVVSVETEMTFVSQAAAIEQLTPEQKSRMEIIEGASPVSSGRGGDEEEDEKESERAEKELGDEKKSSNSDISQATKDEEKGANEENWEKAGSAKEEDDPEEDRQMLY